MTPQRFTVYDVFTRNAAIHAGRTAVVQGTTRLTFFELWQRVEALAAGLHGRGVGHGDRVCILAQNDVAYLDLYGACAKLGAIAYPINWRLTAEEVGRVLERAQPTLFVTDDATLETVRDWPETKSGVAHWCKIGAAQGGFAPLDELYLDGGTTGHGAEPDDPFAVISTAAVDVIPRGAVLTHANILASNLQTQACMQVTEEDAYLAILPLYHIAALGYALAVLHAGGKNVIMPRFDADEAVALIDRERVTMLSDFPPVLLNLLNAAEQARSRLPSLRAVAGLEAPDTIARLHKDTDAQFWSGFGQSETTGFVTIQKVADHPGSAGKAAPLCEVRIVDDYDREVDMGHPGEILVRGPIVMQGYYGQPDVTEVTMRGGWHHTGDVGKVDEEGWLYYVKRKAEKELIKPGGENVYPAEVETVIMELDGVHAVCVFGVSDPQWGEAIKAVVEPAKGATLTAEAVIDHVAARIARFKKPKHVEFTDALPITPEGDVDREAVKEKWGDKPA